MGNEGGARKRFNNQITMHKHTHEHISSKSVILEDHSSVACLNSSNTYTIHCLSILFSNWKILSSLFIFFMDSCLVMFRLKIL